MADEVKVGDGIVVTSPYPMKCTKQALIQKYFKGLAE